MISLQYSSLFYVEIIYSSFPGFDLWFVCLGMGHVSHFKHALILMWGWCIHVCKYRLVYIIIDPSFSTLVSPVLHAKSCGRSTQTVTPHNFYTYIFFFCCLGFFCRCVLSLQDCNRGHNRTEHPTGIVEQLNRALNRKKKYQSWWTFSHLKRVHVPFHNFCFSPLVFMFIIFLSQIRKVIFYLWVHSYIPSVHMCQ